MTQLNQQPPLNARGPQNIGDRRGIPFLLETLHLFGVAAAAAGSSTSIQRPALSSAESDGWDDEREQAESSSTGARSSRSGVIGEINGLDLLPGAEISIVSSETWGD